MPSIPKICKRVYRAGQRRLDSAVSAVGRAIEAAFGPQLKRSNTKRSLRRLYGPQTWKHLLNRKRQSQSNPELNARIASTAAQLAGEHQIPGSSTREGWLYHAYALPELDFTCHRENTHLRLAKLQQLRTIRNERILDIGCSCGAISTGLSLLGAKQVIGVDYDPHAIQLAQLMSQKYDIPHVEFQAADITKFEAPRVDGIVWLSNWMWIVQQLGIETAKDLLFDLVRTTGAQWMIFESAANEGRAAIAGMTQDRLLDVLKDCSPFSQIRATGPFPDNWRRKGDERQVFLCEQPVYEWSGKKSQIMRESRHTIIKRYEADQAWATNWERRCLERVSDSPFFPKVLDSGEDWLRLEWCGQRVTGPEQLQTLNEAVAHLSAKGIQHRDLCPQNLLWRDGQLKIIDFEWAVIDGELPPLAPASGLGRGYYDASHHDSSAVKALVHNFHRKKAA